MNERLDISDFWSVMAGYGPAFWCGVVTAVIVFIAEAILCKRGIIFAGGEKKIAKARAAGNIIQATMVSCRYKDRGPNQNTANRMYIASYEYTVNGVKKRKSIVSTSIEPPRRIYLYYISNPKKVFSEYDAESGHWQILLYIVPVLAAFCVMKLLGFEG